MKKAIRPATTSSSSEKALRTPMACSAALAAGRPTAWNPAARRPPKNLFNKRVNTNDSGMNPWFFPPPDSIQCIRRRACFSRAFLLRFSCRSFAQQPHASQPMASTARHKATQKRRNRAMETFQATINHPCKNGEPEHKEETTTRALAGVLCLSMRALITRTSRCHSMMLAAEISAPVSSMAALRQPAANQHRERRYRAYNQCVMQRPPQHRVQVFVGQVNNRVSFLGHDLAVGGSLSGSVSGPSSPILVFFSAATAIWIT